MLDNDSTSMIFIDIVAAISVVEGSDLNHETHLAAGPPCSCIMDANGHLPMEADLVSLNTSRVYPKVCSGWWFGFFFPIHWECHHPK